MVKNFFKNGTALLFQRQNSILSAAFVIALTVIASRLLGLVRDRLLASYFGASPELAAYIAASRIPEMLFEILILGALSVAFIPVFTEYIAQKKQEEAWHITSSMINGALLLFVVIGSIALIFSRNLSYWVAPGLVNNNNYLLDLTSNLTRIMLFTQLFFILSGFVTAVLQSYQRFLIPAMAAIFYNLGVICGIIFLGPQIGVFGPAIGMIAGALIHLLIQVPLVRALGFKYSFRLDFRHPGVREIGRLVLPRVFGVTAAQLNETANIILASLISAKSIVALNFAQHLQLAPLGLFAATIAQAALPTLSSEVAQKKQGEFKTTLLTSMHQILFLILPASAILIILRIPMVRLIFGAARFDWEATVLTGRTLAFFSASLFAQGAILLLARGFYALHNTKTPVKIGIASICTNIVLSLFFVQYLHLPIWALGASYSIATILNALLLLVFLDRAVEKFNRRELIIPGLKIGFAAVLMAVCLYIPMKFLDQLVFDTTKTINLLALTGAASFLGLSVYLILTWLLQVKEISLFWGFVRRIRIIKEAPIESEEIIDTTTPH